MEGWGGGCPGFPKLEKGKKEGTKPWPNSEREQK